MTDKYEELAIDLVAFTSVGIEQAREVVSFLREEALLDVEALDDYLEDFYDQDGFGDPDEPDSEEEQED